MHDIPTFSVVIPAYNRADTILQTLKSVQRQTYRGFECLVVDDGSADSEELERVVRGLHDQRFVYIRRENGGGGAARNTGIENARGKFIAFLDSDDLFLEEKLAYVAERLPENRKLVLYGQNLVDRGSGRRWVRPDRAIRPNERVASYLFIANQFIQTSTIVVPTELAKAVKFDPTLRKGQDLDFCVRLEEGGAQFQMLERPLSIWFDISEAGRTSRTRGYEQPEKWLAAHRHLLTFKERVGYRSTSLAYYWGWSKPFHAAWFIFLGLFCGVSLSVSARQAARAFLPKSFYRKAVDQFVAAVGRA